MEKSRHRICTVPGTVGFLGPVYILDKAVGHEEENKSYSGRLSESGTLQRPELVVS